ncbi:hypothetical protein C0036_08015, partial [Streptomyces sp. DJ]
MRPTSGSVPGPGPGSDSAPLPGTGPDPGPADGIAPFAPESVLTAVGTGTFVWQKRSDTARLDAETARLLGLPPHPATLRTSAVRCRLHAEDYVELTSLTSLALAEDSVLEALLRVVDEAGTVLRVVCVRIRSLEAPGPLRIVGTVQEVRDEDLRAAGGLRGAGGL